VVAEGEPTATLGAGDVTWSSADPAVATVDTSGTVSAL